MPKIRYIKNEFRFGITEYKTPCPFGMRDPYALQVYEVASRMCKDCPHFVKDDQFNSVLTCSYQEKPEQQEKEHQEKNVFDASCVLLVIGNYKKAPYTYKFQEIRDRKVTRVKKMPLAKFKYLLDLFGGTPYITFKK